MEEHTVVGRLDQSREEIRELLMPGASSGRIIPGHFPRSAVMRFMVDSRKRRLAMAVLTTALMFVGRRRREAGARGGSSRWPRLQALLPLLSGSRR